MKTSFTATRTVFKALASANTREALNLTGKVYWLVRPKNSNKEDIVVLPLAMNAEVLQEGIVNVNIHVPNLVLADDDTQPNFERFEMIANHITSTLKDVWGTDYNFKIDDAATPIPDGKNWFCNIRIRYWTLNN